MKDKDYKKEISEIRSMMERSSKFLSLSGWAGILAGIYALAGAVIAYKVFDFNPDKIIFNFSGRDGISAIYINIILLAIMVLFLALTTALYFTYKKSDKRGEKLWNSTSKRLLVNMAVPMVAGGVVIIVLIINGLTGLIAPFSLLFYGLALFNASRLTIKEVEILGYVQIFLGLTGSLFVEYGLLLWALGFGVAHIIYGIYMYYKYER
ncbi:MAG: hypothetical protein Q8S04_05670 [Bacteroidales bacterium]|nr:hypothetical protein [Bacteroidales bacterium]